MQMEILAIFKTALAYEEPDLLLNVLEALQRLLEIGNTVSVKQNPIIHLMIQENINFDLTRL